ncbi:SGNH/GDSL hydrolase family protein [Blastococcus xanthinilyticus]|uniref:GDSL-like lipase/acylhydrolase family protein n=1 Tax=Blastococcus xanthinilyticus TaxID=1564164 RepID=A0A5S5CLM5_9ACTN|nr:GDSL-type esterase/lipase family protein [Blastococcus xanthinilyticus]TYP82088.1 GDSL-like lipase/acylhydrolase family protein [Blastococcus xanthinilyticus]
MSLTRFDAGRDAARAGTGPLDIIGGPGDSVAEARDVGTENGWLAKLTARLRARWQPAGVPGGEGYVPSYYVSSGVVDRWTFTGGTPNLAPQYGLGHRHHHFVSGGIVQSLTFTGTRIQVMWAGSVNTGVVGISIDGGPAVSVNTATGFTSSTPAGGGSWLSPALARGSHTITLTNTSGKIVLLSGAYVYDGDESTGVRMWEAGHSGWEAEDYANRSPNNTSHAATIAAIAPHLVILPLGYNDWANGRTSAQFQTDLTKIITDTKAAAAVDPDFLIVAYPARTDSPAAVVEPWANFVTAMQSVATAQGAEFLQISAVPTLDGVHPTADGHTTIAAEVEAFLAPASAVTGSGALTAGAPTLAGAGTLRATGSGALTAPQRTLAGSGQLRATGGGALTPAAASLSGTGALAVAGSGALTAPARSVQASGQLTITGTATLTAAGWSLAAAASVTLTGAGALAPAPAVLASSGSVTTPQPDTVTGGGALTAPAPTLAGAATVRLAGSGALTAPTSTLQAAGTVTGPQAQITHTAVTAAVAAHLSAATLAPHLGTAVLAGDGRSTATLHTT